AFGVEEAGVLPPISLRFIPGGPQPSGPVAGQANVGAAARRLLGHQHVAELAARTARQAADADAVAAGVVAVPADPDAVLLVVGGDGGVPVGGLAGADVDGVVPAVGIGTACEDVGLAVAEALPDEPGPAAAVGGHAVPDVRPGVGREPDLVAELALLVGAGVQVPVAVALAGPD